MDDDETTSYYDYHSMMPQDGPFDARLDEEASLLNHSDDMLNTLHFSRDVPPPPVVEPVKPNRANQWYYYIICTIITVIIWALSSFLLYNQYGIDLVMAIASSRIVVSLLSIGVMGMWMDGWHLKRVFIIEGILIAFSLLMIAAVKHHQLDSTTG